MCQKLRLPHARSNHLIWRKNWHLATRISPGLTESYLRSWSTRSRLPTDPILPLVKTVPHVRTLDSGLGSLGPSCLPDIPILNKFLSSPLLFLHHCFGKTSGWFWFVGTPGSWDILWSKPLRPLGRILILLLQVQGMIAWMLTKDLVWAVYQSFVIDGHVPDFCWALGDIQFTT
jgi:hypothetical protein